MVELVRSLPSEFQDGKSSFVSCYRPLTQKRGNRGGIASSRVISELHQESREEGEAQITRDGSRYE